MIHLAIKSSAFVAEIALKNTLSARLLRYHGRLVEHISVLTIRYSNLLTTLCRAASVAMLRSCSICHNINFSFSFKQLYLTIPG